MLKSLSTLLLLFVLLLSGQVSAREVAGVDLPETLSVGEQELVLNGAGVREKWFMNIYVGALYLPEPMSDPQRVIDADKPMLIRLKIVSDMVTGEKLRDATMEGFERSTGERIEEIRDEVEYFLAGFDEEVKAGDHFDISYLPGQGIRVSKNGQDKDILARGLMFKKAVFGIWLSDDPVQSELKEGMLGR